MAGPKGEVPKKKNLAKAFENMAHTMSDKAQTNEPNNDAIHSSESMKEEAVIIIKPEDPNIFRNPITLGNALRSSAFHKYEQQDVKNVNVNKKKCLIAITLKDTKENIDNLVKVTKIGNIRVTCVNKLEKTIPTVRIGVIHPVSTDIPIDDLTPLIKVKHDSISIFDPEIEVQSIERMQRKVGTQKEDSQSIKIFFVGPVLPKAVTIMHSYYKVNPYVALPLQCYKCQRIGHTAKSCTAQARCMLCGGPHTKNECSVTDESNHRCANCRGRHKANSTECETYQEAKAIERLRAKNNTTFREAQIELKSLSNKTAFPSLPDRSNNSNRNLGQSTYASHASPAVVPSPTHRVEMNKKDTRATQTLPETPTSNSLIQIEAGTLKEIIKSILTDILGNFLPNPAQNVTEEALTSVVEKAISSNHSRKRRPSPSSSEAQCSELSSDEDIDYLMRSHNSATASPSKVKSNPPSHKKKKKINKNN